MSKRKKTLADSIFDELLKMAQNNQTEGDHFDAVGITRHDLAVAIERVKGRSPKKGKSK